VNVHGSFFDWFVFPSERERRMTQSSQKDCAFFSILRRVECERCFEKKFYRKLTDACQTKANNKKKTGMIGKTFTIGSKGAYASGNFAKTKKRDSIVCKRKIDEDFFKNSHVFHENLVQHETRKIKFYMLFLKSQKKCPFHVFFSEKNSETTEIFNVFESFSSDVGVPMR
jgi:hypothetical protein